MTRTPSRTRHQQRPTYARRFSILRGRKGGKPAGSRRTPRPQARARGRGTRRTSTRPPPSRRRRAGAPRDADICFSTTRLSRTTARPRRHAQATTADWPTTAGRRRAWCFFRGRGTSPSPRSGEAFVHWTSAPKIIASIFVKRMQALTEEVAFKIQAGPGRSAG